MKNLSNSHDIVRQNDENVRTSQKHEVNVQKNSTLYFQIGLILTLLVTYALFEMQFPITDNNVPPPYLIEDDPAYTKDVIAYVEPVKKTEKKPEPLRSKRITTTPVIADNNKLITDLPLFTEPPSIDNPTSDLTLPMPPKPKEPIRANGVEQLPVFPGCEGITDRDAQLECFNKKIIKLVGRKFNTDVVDGLRLNTVNKIYVEFTIDVFGHVADIKARGPHQKLEKEAKRVIGKIPQLMPGKQNNEPVAVIYTIPIVVKSHQ